MLRIIYQNNFSLMLIASFSCSYAYMKYIARDTHLYDYSFLLIFLAININIFFRIIFYLWLILNRILFTKTYNR